MEQPTVPPQQNINQMTNKPTLGTGLLVLIGGIFLLGIGLAGGWYFVNQIKQEPQIKTNRSLIPARTSNNTINFKETETDKIEESNLKTFISKKLGISFTYMASNEGVLINTKESDRKVYIGMNTMKVEDGQSVEIFEKTADETIEEAIKRLILKDKPADQCFVEIKEAKGYSSNFVQAEITYPRNDSDEPETLFTRSDFCSPDYAQTNGIRYFLMDKDHPTKLLFFNIGQYGIMSENNIPWQQTISILD